MFKRIMVKCLVLVLVFSNGAIAQTRLKAGNASAAVLEITINPSNLFNRIHEEIMVGDAEDAFALLERAEKTNLSPRQRSSLHNGYCVVYQMFEDFRQSLHHCNMAIRRKPNNWRYLNNRGNAFLNMGSPGLALRDYRAALKMAPNAKALRFNIRLAEEKAASDNRI